MAKTKQRVFAFLPLFLTIALLAVFLITTQNLAFATTIIHTPFTQMCQEADAIIEAIVQSKSSRIVGDSTVPFPEIVTDVVLANIVTLKGNRPNPLTLTYPGGTVGGITMSVPGMPRFEVGERKVLFLREGNILFGVWEGTFTIKQDVSGVTTIERADGFLVTGDFDESTGEIALHAPGQRISKPVLFMEEQGFRNLIGELSRKIHREPGEVSE